MENKNLILAVVLSVALLWGYTTFIAPPPPKPSAPAEQVKGKNGQQDPAGAAAPTTTPPSAQQAREIVVETKLAQYTFSELGGALRKVMLKKYSMEPEHKGGPFVLLNLAKGDPSSLNLSLPKLDPQLGLRNFAASTEKLKLDQGDQPQSLSFRAKSAGLDIEKIYTFKPNSYAFNLAVKITNSNGQAMEVISELSLFEYAKKAEVNTYAFTGILGWRDNRLAEYAAGDLKEEAKVESGSMQWLAMSIPYFQGAVVPTTKEAEGVKRSLRGTAKDGLMNATLVEPMQNLAAGESQQLSFLVFYGPRDLEILESLGHNLAASVDFGWFDLIAKPMLAALNFFERYVNNYGIAIIIITILFKIMLWPVAAKSYKSMKKMQELQPVMTRLREKYKDNRERLQQETMQLYKTYKVNPLGGCLPMLVQFPVFIAFYKVLGSAIELRHAPFILWINDLSAPDRLPLGFNFAIPFVQTGYGLPVLTIFMGASMFIQQKMTPATGDPTQAKMMLMMPVVFTFMFLNFPSGLVLYWLVQGILSIGQQYWTNTQKL
jgi:YidC/Oxa1 family membrane protein insertase